MIAETTWFHYTVQVNVISVPIELILIYEVSCFRKNAIIISNLLHHSACAIVHTMSSIETEEMLLLI